jgi:transcriptional regulator with XRE-family HTH domain
MNAQALGIELATWRREAGLTQDQLAARMQAKQPVISRVESGRVLPTLLFLERFAEACGRSEIVLRFGGPSRRPSLDERRERVRRVLGGFVFNPWDRNPSAEEARTLIADGLTRERFEGPGAASTR